jgi:hypothetical protein
MRTTYPTEGSVICKKNVKNINKNIPLLFKMQVNRTADRTVVHVTKTAEPRTSETDTEDTLQLSETESFQNAFESVSSQTIGYLRNLLPESFQFPENEVEYKYDADQNAHTKLFRYQDHMSADDLAAIAQRAYTNAKAENMCFQSLTVEMGNSEMNLPENRNGWVDITFCVVRCLVSLDRHGIKFPTFTDQASVAHKGQKAMPFWRERTWNPEGDSRAYADLAERGERALQSTSYNVQGPREFLEEDYREEE